VQALCPGAVDATRFLRTHSCLESEVKHVEETIAFVASLPANDRIRVVQETYESALIMAQGYNHELLKSDAEILEKLQQTIAAPSHAYAPPRACSGPFVLIKAKPQVLEAQ
jgi:hypothetical protein